MFEKRCLDALCGNEHREARVEVETRWEDVLYSRGEMMIFSPGQQQ